ncbi:unnamed protein product [Cylicostephanus goldi]|uniref:DNA2/NAM7 helicase-like C-terminal domain-containing protein n=1 Tax=Cylicostephanus goldi TaxID=71465 RepID=A0A3P7LTA8_CYLGO|nr:unnamed protein product [Cylicostephanus goldi]
MFKVRCIESRNRTEQYKQTESRSSKGIAPNDIVIISFYKEHSDASRNLPHVQELSTVDAVQGCKKEAIVILTTKTNFDPEGAEFLDDKKRMNVVLTRCRQGQFLLGHYDSLVQLPFWGKVLQWSNEHHAVIPSAILGWRLGV